MDGPPVRGAAATGARGPGRPLAQLVLGAVIISASPVFVKAAALDGLGPTSIAFWRLALGAAPLLVLARARGEDLRVSRRVFGLALLAGAVFTADLFLWHRSINLVGAGLATILGNTQVFNTAVLAWLLLGERPARSFFPAAALGLAGVVLLVGLGSGVALEGRYLLGVVLGLGTGVAYAGFLLITRTMARRPSRPALLVIVAWVSLLGAACSGAVCLLEDDAFLPRSWGTWLNLAGLGVLVQAVGWWVITAALPRLPGATAGLVLLLQPVLATVWGALLFGERLGPLQLAGAGLTLAAIHLGTRAGPRPT
ncbi:MAG: DMT family transporter [Candidatus Krumholzibacteriia bacterium]